MFISFSLLRILFYGGLFCFTLGANEGRQVGVVLLDYIGKESAGQLVVSLAGEVSVVGLSPADGDPVSHGTEASHAGALIPVGTVHLAADGALGLDDAVDAGEGGPAVATIAQGAVGWADDEDGGVGSEAAAALDDAAKEGGVGFFSPVAIACLVGAVGENDQGGVGFSHEGLLNGFVPAEEEGGFCAVDAGGFVGDASGVFCGEAEEADGSGLGGEDFDVVMTCRDGGVVVACADFTCRECGCGCSDCLGLWRWGLEGLVGIDCDGVCCVCLGGIGGERRFLAVRCGLGCCGGSQGLAGCGGDGGEELIVVADLDAAAVGLDEVLDFEGGRVGVDGDPVPCCFGAETDATHADEAVADVAEVRAEGEPAGGLSAAGAMDAIAGEGVASVLEACAAVAELVLKEGTESAGEHVGCGVGVAELDDADELAVGISLELMELSEEGSEGSGIFNADAGAGQAVVDAVGDDLAGAEGDFRGVNDCGGFVCGVCSGFGGVFF